MSRRRHINRPRCGDRVYEVTLRLHVPSAPHSCGSAWTGPEDWDWQALLDEHDDDLPRVHRREVAVQHAVRLPQLER